ncbi:DUF2463 domain-containing protein [Encephalitozoon hellem]|nr:DUF2463 domain-containing protein [Encephalitozoon hellem]
MNVSINLPELDQADEHTKEHRAALGCRDILHICAALISMALPIIICLLPEESGDRLDTLFKLAMSFPPFLCLGIQCLILFDKNIAEQSESPSTLSSALVFLLNTLLLLFSAISLISIIALTIENWDEDSVVSISLMLPPLFASIHLLDTSCSLTHSDFHYTTTNTADILLDLLIFLAVLASTACFVFKTISQTLAFCSIIVSTILILIRSWREKYLPSAKYEGSVVPWRVAISIIILVIATIIYAIMGYKGSAILRKRKLFLS